MTNSKTYGMTVRIVAQLDLARQKESVPFICEHIDFLAANGYTGVMLYLEGGVRTASFAFADPDKSYSVGEMRTVVDHAARCGMEVIPALNTLGHCELFLRHPELAHLAEHTPPRNEVCPSNPATLEFFERYLAEIAEIFPSKYLHIGCDEVFTLASCPVCRARLAAGETRGDIFGKHVAALAEIVRKLGKIPQIWDDMADFFPEILDRIPTSVEMVFWEYNRQIDSKLVKYGNRKRLDVVAEYRKRGFSLIGAPRDWSFSNVFSMTNAVMAGDPVEMLLTSWENHTKFAYSWYPLTAFAGRWWRCGGVGDAERIFAEAVRDLFGFDEPDFAAAVRLYSDLPHENAPMRADWTRSGIRKYPNNMTLQIRAGYALIAAVFERCAGRVSTGLGKRVLTAMRNELESWRLALECKLWLNDCFRAGCAPDAESLCTALTENWNEKIELWKIFRPGIVNDRMTALRDEMRAGFDRAAALAAKTPALLELGFMLPDYYGREKIRVEVQYAGPDRWHTVFEGTPKPSGCEYGDTPYYTDYALLQSPDVARVRITATGDNGVGLANVTVETASGRRLPQWVTVRGDVADAESLLVDDTRWAMLGNRDGLTSLWNPEMSQKPHVVELEF